MKGVNQIRGARRGHHLVGRSLGEGNGPLVAVGTSLSAASPGALSIRHWRYLRYGSYAIVHKYCNANYVVICTRVILENQARLHLVPHSALIHTVPTLHLARIKT